MSSGVLRLFGSDSVLPGGFSFAGVRPFVRSAPRQQKPVSVCVWRGGGNPAASRPGFGTTRLGAGVQPDAVRSSNDTARTHTIDSDRPVSFPHRIATAPDTDRRSTRWSGTGPRVPRPCSHTPPHSLTRKPPWSPPVPLLPLPRFVVVLSFWRR